MPHIAEGRKPFLQVYINGRAAIVAGNLPTHPASVPLLDSSETVSCPDLSTLQSFGLNSTASHVRKMPCAAAHAAYAADQTRPTQAPTAFSNFAAQAPRSTHHCDQAFSEQQIRDRDESVLSNCVTDGSPGLHSVLFFLTLT